jgi:hypothetical protein
MMKGVCYDFIRVGMVRVEHFYFVARLRAEARSILCLCWLWTRIIFLTVFEMMADTSVNIKFVIRVERKLFNFCSIGNDVLVHESIQSIRERERQRRFGLYCRIVTIFLPTIVLSYRYSSARLHQRSQPRRESGLSSIPSITSAFCPRKVQRCMLCCLRCRCSSVYIVMTITRTILLVLYFPDRLKRILKSESRRRLTSSENETFKYYGGGRNHRMKLDYRYVVYVRDETWRIDEF